MMKIIVESKREQMICWIQADKIKSSACCVCAWFRISGLYFVVNLSSSLWLSRDVTSLFNRKYHRLLMMLKVASLIRV